MVDRAPRKTMAEVFRSVYGAVPEQRFAEPIATIAFKAGVSYGTAERYVAIMREIQSWHEIVEEQIGSQKGYRREPVRKRQRGTR